MVGMTQTRRSLEDVPGFLCAPFFAACSRTPPNRILPLASIALVAACSGLTSSTPGPAAHLSAGTSDTIIINTDGAPTPLRVQALDARGRLVTRTAIRYERTGGDPLPLTANGEVSCGRRGDVVVRARLAQLSKSFFVRCRPVDYVQIPGPLQFVLGDSLLSQPRLIPVAAYDANRRAVSQLAGTLTLLDTSLAHISGTTLFPRSRGISVVGAHVGSGSGWIGLHIYQRVDSLSALDTLLHVRPHQRLFAVPLRLAPGESRSRRLPPGMWMVTTQAQTQDGPKPFRVRVENAASCLPNLLNDPGRFGCRTGGNATVVVYRPFVAGDTASAAGYLLVRWMFQ